MSWDLPPMALGRIDPREEFEFELAPITADSSLDFLQKVYSDPAQPITRRMRAAIAALPFEHPKLAVTANINGDGFAARLEAAIARTAGMRAGLVIEGTALAPITEPCPSDSTR